MLLMNGGASPQALAMRSRSTWPLLLGIAALSGCVHASYETTRAAVDPIIELQACTFVSARPDALDRATRRNLRAIQRQFKETKPQLAPFRSRYQPL